MILEFWQGAGDPVRGAAVLVCAAATACALGAAGSALFLVFMSERLTVEEARAARRRLLLFALGALFAGAALWPFRAAALTGVTAGMGRWPIYTDIARSPFGDAAFTMAAGVALLLFARVRTAWGAGLGTAGALLVCIGLALAGHAGGHARRQEVLALSVVHAMAAAFWFGGLFSLRTVAGRRDPRSAAEAVLAWSRHAMVFAGLAVASGLALALAFAGPPTQMVRSGYGWVVLAKSGLVVAMVLGALASRFRHARLMERGDVLAGDALRSSCTRQILFALLILYAGAELTAADLPAAATR